MDDDNNRCMVKLSLSGETVSVSHFSVRLVDKKEFDKYSRYLNKGMCLEIDVLVYYYHTYQRSLILDWLRETGIVCRISPLGLIQEQEIIMF